MAWHSINDSLGTINDHISTSGHIDARIPGPKPTAQNAMAPLYQYLLLLLSISAYLSAALKFEIQAQPSGVRPRCIRNFVSKDTLVVVTATVSGTKGDGQKVNIHVRYSHDPQFLGEYWWNTGNWELTTGL